MFIAFTCSSRGWARGVGARCSSARRPQEESVNASAMSATEIPWPESEAMTSDHREVWKKETLAAHQDTRRAAQKSSADQRGALTG